VRNKAAGAGALLTRATFLDQVVARAACRRIRMREFVEGSKTYRQPNGECLSTGLTDAVKIFSAFFSTT
jgi:hypothetical protein